MGAGNYKVQNIDTQRVYVSRDVIFEEGQPHRTSTSVGEKMIPLFDTLDIHDTPDTAINPDHAITDPAVTPKLRQPTRQPDISGITELRQSNRAPKPSQAGLHSTECKQRDEAGKEDEQDWATDRPRAASTISYLC